MSDDGWVLVYEELDPGKQGLRETLCALGNGVFVTRGAAEESQADGVHYPGTYLAGGYNRLSTEIAGETIVNEDLVNFPNWLPLTFRPARGEWLDLGQVEIRAWRVELDMKRGVLTRQLRFQDRDGRETDVASRRIVHMGQPDLAAIEYVITPLNWSGRVDVRSEIDGSVTNGGVPRYRDLASGHLECVDAGAHGESGIWLLARTTQSRLEMGLAARTRAFGADERLDEERRVVQEPGRVGLEMAVDGEEGQPIHVEKIVSIHNSRDGALSEAALESREALDRCGRFDELLESHVSAWSALWHRFDVEVDPPGQEQLLLRLHTFHALQTLSPNTLGRDVGIPARGWHGEAYRGHVFWDEVFIYPFFTSRDPSLTRSLLLYRYRRLPWARWLARQEGYSGAMFPWQSGSNGQEETQVIHLNPKDNTWGPDLSRRQRHVNVAIAYNVWQYYRSSGDREFLSRYGAELVLEIARFFGSLATLDEATGRYEIRGVMGPDEYHEKYPGSDEPGLRNNAYTNVMVVWCVDRALEVLELLPPSRVTELRDSIGLGSEEVERWQEISRKMTVPLHADGVISQFQGYEELEEFDWDAARAKHGNISRLDRILKAEGDSPDRFKLAKQADVLMLFYLLSPEEVASLLGRLGYPFDHEALRRTVEYYLPRTSHGSTLSKVVHASMIDDFDRQHAWELFQQALLADFADVQGGTTPEGIHLGAMTGTVDIVIRRYAGVDVTGPVLVIAPRLPDPFRRLRLRVVHLGRWYELHIDGPRVRLELEKGSPGTGQVQIFGEELTLEPGQQVERGEAP